MTISLILTIVGAIGLQVIAFKIQQYFSTKKVNELKDEIAAKNKEIVLLEKEKEVRGREKQAGADNDVRKKLSKKKSDEIKTKIKDAKTDEEILNIAMLIDSNNTFRVL